MNNTHHRRAMDTPRPRGKVVISTSGRFIKMKKIKDVYTAAVTPEANVFKVSLKRLI